MQQREASVNQIKHYNKKKKRKKYRTQPHHTKRSSFLRRLTCIMWFELLDIKIAIEFKIIKRREGLISEISTD